MLLEENKTERNETKKKESNEDVAASHMATDVEKMQTNRNRLHAVLLKDKEDFFTAQNLLKKRTFQIAPGRSIIQVIILPCIRRGNAIKSELEAANFELKVLEDQRSEHHGIILHLY